MSVLPPPPRYPRVTKTLRPHQPGTLRLLRQYGDALVCVRYREDGRGRRRCTTVELIIDEGPVKRRQNLRAIVYVPIALRESELRRRASAMGATWSVEHDAWRMTYGTATALGIAGRLRQSIQKMSRDEQRR